MNRKGGVVLHWTLMGLVAALGFFFLMTANLDLGTKARGTWQISGLEVFHDVEFKLAEIDAQALFIAEKVSEGFNYLANDLGCGKHDDVSLLNTEDNFCQFDVAGKFKEKFKVAAEGKLTYDELVVIDNYIVGKVNEEKRLRSQKSVKSNLFTVFYYYNPSFRTKVPIISKYKSIQSHAQFLLDKCRDKKDLQQCLSDKKRTDWMYGKCGQEGYNEDKRKIIFCAKEESFAINFYPTKPFPVNEIVAIPVENTDQYQVSFTYDEFAEQFKIYFTNELSIDMGFQGPIGNLIVLPGNFFESLTISDIVKDESKCSLRQVGKAYLCSGAVIYIIDHLFLEQGQDYLFTVTALKNNEESFVQKFVLNG